MNARPMARWRDIGSRLRRHPALVLFFIAPIFGELFSGATPLPEFINPITLFILALLYGNGAILARELTIRWGKDWRRLLLLGMAYGIYEEGLVVRSFFDPQWPDLGNMATYGRVAGVNLVWAVHLTAFHTAISIMSSVAFVEILYPARRAERWVRDKRLWRLVVPGLLLMLPIGKLLTPYDAPDAWVFACWLSIAGLLAIARRLPTPPTPGTSRRVPSAWRFFFLALAGVFVHFFVVYEGADARAYPFPVALLLLLAVDLGVLWLVWRWSGQGLAWDDRHRLALIIGALSFFLGFVPLTTGTPLIFLGNPVFFLLLWLTYRRVSRRVEGTLSHV